MYIYIYTYTLTIYVSYLSVEPNTIQVHVTALHEGSLNHKSSCRVTNILKLGVKTRVIEYVSSDCSKYIKPFAIFRIPLFTTTLHQWWFQTTYKRCLFHWTYSYHTYLLHGVKLNYFCAEIFVKIWRRLYPYNLFWYSRKSVTSTFPVIWRLKNRICVSVI